MPYFEVGSIDDEMPYVITQSVSSIAAGSSIRIPETGTDDHIKTTSTIIPMFSSTGVYFSGVTVSSGYVTYTVPQAISSGSIKLLIFNK